ncbi:hypothetical protein ACF0H5_019136 [Mactra antiquata]
MDKITLIVTCVALVLVQGHSTESVYRSYSGSTVSTRQTIKAGKCTAYNQLNKNIAVYGSQFRHILIYFILYNMLLTHSPVNLSISVTRIYDLVSVSFIVQSQQNLV